MKFDGSMECMSCFATHNCKLKVQLIDGELVSNNVDYMERFVVFRMNRAGFLFGARRHVEVNGFQLGSVGHDESAVSQHFSLLNTQMENYQ